MGSLYHSALIELADQLLLALPGQPGSILDPKCSGYRSAAFILSWFLSGFFMPLRFFPEWFVKLCYLTPFPYTINAVVEVYLGLIDGNALVGIILAQIAWVLLLVLAGMVTLRAGVRRLEILGG